MARGIADAGWGELVRQLAYKQEWNGGRIVKIDRFFPSSKTCSSCGFVCQALPLSVRQWKCPRCKTMLDRDVNAAINIKQAGELLGVEAKALVRVKTRTKLLPVKHGYAQG